MTAVFVVRHPETTWNVAQRYQGRLESPLSEQGHIQARMVSRVFEGQKLDVVYSSPLKRALDLGAELARVTDAPLRTDQRLTEIGQCPWEGLHLAAIRERYPELYEAWYQRPDEVEFPDGEGLHAVHRRAISAMKDIQQRHPEGSVGVVTHSVVIQVLVAAALSLDLRHLHKVRVSNAGITTFCGTELAGGLLELNSGYALSQSPVATAAAQKCATWKQRRVTQ
jgi:broad specificity phosphatase PhoE